MLQSAVREKERELSAHLAGATKLHAEWTQALQRAEALQRRVDDEAQRTREALEALAVVRAEAGRRAAALNEATEELAERNAALRVARQREAALSAQVKQLEEQARVQQQQGERAVLSRANALAALEGELRRAREVADTRLAEVERLSAQLADARGLMRERALELDRASAAQRFPLTFAGHQGQARREAERAQQHAQARWPAPAHHDQQPQQPMQPAFANATQAQPSPIAAAAAAYHYSKFPSPSAAAAAAAAAPLSPGGAGGDPVYATSPAGYPQQRYPSTPQQRAASQSPVRGFAGGYPGGPAAFATPQSAARPQSAGRAHPGMVAGASGGHVDRGFGASPETRESRTAPQPSPLNVLYRAFLRFLRPEPSADADARARPRGLASPQASLWGPPAARRRPRGCTATLRT